MSKTWLGFVGGIALGAVLVQAVNGRYEVSKAVVPMRLDRWTGQVWMFHGSAGEYTWSPVPESSH